MFKKLLTFAVLPLLAISSFLSAEVQYDIHDIDTLQTHSSEAIALNNQGQILGWYNIDGSKDGKLFFVRNRNGDFHEIPGKTLDANLAINWQYLTNEGKAYGTFAVNQATTALCTWDEANGFVKLGVMPGKEVVAVNNVGQVLIKSVQESENGKKVTRPVIWHNNKITKLKGLEGDLGVESDESYGFDMNNKGEIVGQSLISLVYKNNIYYQVHAVKWVDGKAIDLHKTIPKSGFSSALAINDIGDILLKRDGTSNLNTKYILNSDGSCRNVNSVVEKINNNGFGYFSDGTYDKEGKLFFYRETTNKQLESDFSSIWVKVVKIVSLNDNGEIIAEGQTIYGEKHAMFLTPSEKQ